MKVFHWIEAHFWAFLLFAMLFGLLVPLPTEQLLPLLKPELMLTLLLIFLKIDVIQILERIKDYRLMLYLCISFLLLTPLLFYGVFSLWDAELAMGVLLLTAMPAGTSAPVLVDILKGNASLAMSITILTSLLAPFTLPLLFHFLIEDAVAINHWSLFWDAATMIFIPMVASIIIKPMFPRFIKKALPSFTAINIIILFAIVVTSFGSQRQTIMANPLALFWDIMWMYLVFTLLHIVGYLLAFGLSREEKIAVVTERAYMNSGLAIVLAANFFPPYVLVLMVISEIPWSTMLIPLRWLIRNTSLGHPK